MTRKEATAQRLRDSIAYLGRKGDRMTVEEKKRLAGLKRSLEMLGRHANGRMTFLTIDEEDRWTRG